MRKTLLNIAWLSLFLGLVSCAHIPREQILRKQATLGGRYHVLNVHYDRSARQARVSVRKADPQKKHRDFFRWYAYDRKTKAWRLLPMVAIQRPDAKER